MGQALFSYAGIAVAMSETVEVRLARLEAKFEFMFEDAKEAKVSRKAQYDAIEKLNTTLTAMAGEVTDVKGKLAGQAPTIEEFITIKHKVVGAGKLGGWLWTAGAFLIGLLAASRESIIDWISK